MPQRPGTTITVSSVPQAATPGQRLGTFFVAAQTERGPLVGDATRPLRNLADFAAVYGTRNGSYGSSVATYDALDAFWRAGGGPVILARVVGPAAVAAAVTLQDRAGTPVNTLKVSSKGPGAWGNTHLTVTVANGAASNTFNLTVLVDGAQVEVSPDLSTPSDAVTWSATSKYVTVSDLASGTVAPNNNPAVVSAATFSLGADDLTNVTDTQWTAALSTFPQSYGPGMVAKLGVTSASGHAGTVAHAAANNRLAVLDGPLSAGQSTLTSLASTVQAAAASPEYAMLFAPWVVVPPAAGGAANRKVPASAVAAGLISRQVTTGPADIPAAGANGAAQFVLDTDPAVVFSDADRDALNGTAPVNVLRRPYSASQAPSVELYGYNTLASTSDWRQANNQLLRLRLVDEMRLVAESFTFAMIDGRGQTFAAFAGALTGILQAHADAGELFPSKSGDAFTVDVSSAVNTADTIAAGQLKARVGLCMAPYAEFVYVDVAKFPITQSLSS